MTTLTLPADRVAQQPDGTWLITMPGEIQCDGVRRNGPHDVIGSCCDGVYPPDELVALTESCKTCGGTRVVTLDPPREGDGGIEYKDDCPDCHAGRPLFDLKVECGNDCQRFGGKVPGRVYGSNWDWVPCRTCMGEQFVTHAGLYVPSPILPVLDGAVKQGTYPDDAIYYSEDEGWRMDSAFDIILAKPGQITAQPGDFAVIAKETT